MRCPRCQAENDGAARFCEDCGAHLEQLCPSCGSPITPGKKFCRSCGVSLAAASPSTRFPTPESYTPKHLAEKILISRGALEGERKQVTVLFADVKGSMELLVDRDPEEARAILDPVLDLMMEAVHHYEGTVNQVMGDGIMALFGAPLAHEDHAVRGGYAALRMQAAIKRHADALLRSQGLPIQVRVGLNSGEVVVRAIQSDLRMDYSAVGQTTHLAARMEQLALPGSIRLTAHTVRLVAGRLDVNALGPIPIKGLPDPIEAGERERQPHAPAGRFCGWAHALRRPCGRTRATRGRPGKSWRWPRSSGGRDRRGRRGKIAPRPGTHTLGRVDRMVGPSRQRRVV